MNRDGSRRRIRPKLSKGRYYRGRFLTAWGLILSFCLIPILKINGKPLMLFDITRREFTLFGATFLPTDSFLLMLLLFSIFVGIFLVTAIWGRVWCGWGCPQTVYMEFIYRPLEVFIEGGRNRQIKTDKTGISGRRMIKHLAVLRRLGLSRQHLPRLLCRLGPAARVDDQLTHPAPRRLRRHDRDHRAHVRRFRLVPRTDLHPRLPLRPLPVGAPRPAVAHRRL